ncbi:MAG: hypothetical protein ACR2HR_00510 [Euzebya sp.]
MRAGEGLQVAVMSGLEGVRCRDRIREDSGGIIRGVMLIGLGILLLIIGAAGIAVSQGISRVTAEAQTRMPGSVTLQTVEGVRYGVALDDRGLVRLDGGDEDVEVASTLCTLTQPDGSQAEIRGDVTSAAIQAGGITRFGFFDGMQGATTLDCRYRREIRTPNVQLLVFRIRRGLQTSLFATAGLGLILALFGSLLVWRHSQRSRAGVPAGQVAATGAAGYPPAPAQPPSALPPEGSGIGGILQWSLDQAKAGWQAEHGSSLGQASMDTAGPSANAEVGVGSPVEAASPAQPEEFGTVLGVSLSAYAGAQAGLQRDRVRPEQLDAYLIGHGIAPGTWEQVQQGWQQRFQSDWRAGAAFGQAVQDAKRKR